MHHTQDITLRAVSDLHLKTIRIHVFCQDPSGQPDVLILPPKPRGRRGNNLRMGSLTIVITLTVNTQAGNQLYCNPYH